MLIYDSAHWLAFLTAAFLLNLSPGPDMAFIMGHTLKSGRTAGIIAMLGIWSGALCHVLLAVLGVSAILAASAAAFQLVKWLGVFYLLWLAIKAIRAGADPQQDLQVSKHSLATIYRHGILVNLLNPKVALFFLAFLPQFIEPTQGPYALQMAVHGFLVIITAAFVEPPLIFMGDQLTKKLKGQQKLNNILNHSLAAIYIMLCLRLALSNTSK
ncbi:LysE family translocator [Polycladidibacter stylochi]|uniref:LysE family translocator n=1 Tax=Polycladidibacter stylochi TaxID=1807766 RepID=UPI000836F6BE|nr:LysE family translocator [Pseudovibrio stylochi]